MASIAPDAEAHPSAHDRHDRPWLLPASRRLRNLNSISVRNLSLAQPSTGRRRGHTADDDALANTLISPAKAIALREHRLVEHSRSSSDLRSVAEHAEPNSSHATVDGSDHVNGKPRTPTRPSLARMRRRSTLEWANATPQKRQERLERLTAERMADVFFTCHLSGSEDPFYISEMVPRTMNPTFRSLDLASCGPAVTRADSFILRLWTKSAKMSHWRQHLEMTVEMRGLQYLGKTLDRYRRQLPQNAVIFQLTDGVYASLGAFSDLLPPANSVLARSDAGRTAATSSFDALLRLSKLDDSIQDALFTRNRLAADLDRLLKSQQSDLDGRDRLAEMEDRVKTIAYARMTVEKQLDKARRQGDEKRASLVARRRLMAEDQQRRIHQDHHLRLARPELPNDRDEHEMKRRAIQSQRRRICEDLQICYPIQPMPKKSLAFMIHGLHLPNSDDLDQEPPDKVAAALGHVAHIVVLLAHYLQHPLPYPLHPRSSSSTAEDTLSLFKSAGPGGGAKDDASSRIYPLFARGTARFRFDYAVFLLNKDVQVLLESAFNVRVLDLRHTLPNVKYLLYVATAGAGELPARKAGGVRGLALAKNGVDGDAGRRGVVRRIGSDASSDSALSEGPRWNTVRGNGKAKGSAIESLKRNFAGIGRREGS